MNETAWPELRPAIEERLENWYPRVGPYSADLRAALARVDELTAALATLADQHTHHIYAGACPDHTQPLSRDAPGYCPACDVLCEAERLLERGIVRVADPDAEGASR